MEQLLKFKQNMHLGDWVPTEDKLTVPLKKQQKYQLPTPNQNPASEARGLKARMNNSVDKLTKTNALANPIRNTSTHHKKAMDPYPAPMEQIT